MGVVPPGKRNVVVATKKKVTPASSVFCGGFAISPEFECQLLLLLFLTVYSFLLPLLWEGALLLLIKHFLHSFTSA